MADEVIIIADMELSHVLGYQEGITITDKYGRLSDIGTSDPPVDLWNGGGLYTGHPLGAPETLEIFSSSPNDTDGGTGARTVRITKLLNGGKELQDDVIVTLNGTTPVTIGPELYSRCSRMRVVTVGSSGHNEGELTLRHTTTTANIFAVMPSGKSTTVIMADTVPAGKTLFVKKGNITMSRLSGAAGSANVTIRVREDKPDAPFIAQRDVEITESSPYLFENSGYFVFQEKCDFKVQIEDVSDNSTTISSEFMGFYRDNK